MNAKLDRAIVDIAKADALLSAYERAFFEESYSDEESWNRADRAERLILLIWDAVKQVSRDLDELADDLTVVDAIYAVNEVDRLRAELNKG